MILTSKSEKPLARRQTLILTIKYKNNDCCICQLLTKDFQISDNSEQQKMLKLDLERINCKFRTILEEMIVAQYQAVDTFAPALDSASCQQRNLLHCIH